MNKLENKVSKLLNRQYCLLTGSGTTSMYLIFLTFKKSSIVVFPTITCIQAVNAAVFAGMIPVFCDVNLSDFTMNTKSLKKVLAKYKNIKAIVPTHVFGHSCDVNKIISIARKKNIFILEDAAQSFGSKINNQMTGSFGNASVVSFGHSKILDCGGGGGILTDDLRLHNLIRILYKKIPNQIKHSEDLVNKYRQTYYNTRNSTDNDKRFWQQLNKVQFLFKDVFIYKINRKIENKINKALKTLKKNIKERNKRLNLYKKYLKSYKFKHSKSKNGSVCWRYTFLYNGNRDVLFEKVRKENIDISSWYPPLHKMYSKQKYNFFKNSNAIDKKIVNLWVEPNYSEKKILNNIKKINNLIR